jgi:hypothetical protein
MHEINTMEKSPRWQAAGPSGSEAKPSQRSQTCLAIPAFDRIAGLNNRHLNNRL